MAAGVGVEVAVAVAAGVGVGLLPVVALPQAVRSAVRASMGSKMAKIERLQENIRASFDFFLVTKTYL